MDCLSKIKFTDIVLYNSADQESFNPETECLALLSNDGQINYYPQILMKTTCSIKIEDFPFDEQLCSLRIGRLNRIYSLT